MNDRSQHLEAVLRRTAAPIPDPALQPAIVMALDEPRAVTADEVGRFDRDGYLRLSGVLAPELIAAYEPVITGEVARLNTMHLPMDERSTSGKAFLQVTNLARQDDRVRRFVFGRRLAGIAAALLGVERVRLYTDQALYKEPSGGITPWHADQYYWPLSSDRAVTVWIPLQDTPAAMGPLAFARGSHRFRIDQDVGISDDSEARLAAVLGERGMDVDESPYVIGDVSYHLGWTFHRAPPNRSDEPRRVMTIVYVDAEIRATEPRNRGHRESLEITMGGIGPGDLLDAGVNPVIEPAA